MIEVARVRINRECARITLAVGECLSKRARIIGQDCDAGFRKLDDLVRYRLLDVVVAVSDLQGDADLFERYT